MFRSRWLHNLLDSSRSRQDRRRQASRPRRGVRPMLESLEDRITPSTVMENAADAAMLQTDLTNATAANTQYIINLTGASSAYNLTAGQQLTVSAAASGSSVTIAGTGQSITGNGNRVFDVQTGGNVTLQNLTITGGTLAGASSLLQGGGLFDIGGNVTLSKVTIQGNSITATSGGQAEGGGLFVAGGGNLTIEGGSTIQSNRATGSNIALGGGVYDSGASTVVIRDSTFRNNTAQGGNGTSVNVNGANAQGGGLYVGGSGWNVTLTGDTLSGNSAIGGNGANGAAGSNAATSNTSGGNGGNGGASGIAQGGAAYFTGSASGSDSLTILNDLAAPTTNPSTMIDNSVQAGASGNGGAGGTSTGTANNSNGGNGGNVGAAGGGALCIGDVAGVTLAVNIGNTAFYGNTVSGGNSGKGGAAGTGGSGSAGSAGTSQPVGFTDGGAIYFYGGNVTIINSIVAKNTLTAGFANGGSGTQGAASGGGILDSDTSTAVTLDNNTITQNTSNGISNTGSGLLVVLSNPTLINNLIQGNRSIGSSANDLDVYGGATLNNANNNFITSISSNAVSTTSNIIGNSQTQLGGVVGVTTGGKASGGPIYYPLLSGVVSLGAGTTSTLSTIAAVEGTTTANATDAIGNLRSSNGSIDLGAVQFVPSPSPSPSPSPTPPAKLSPFEDLLAITLDTDALLFQNYPPALSFLTMTSEWLLGQPLPPTADLISTIEADSAALLAAILADLP